MQSIDSTTYFSSINIPDDWNTLEDFVQWYIDSRMPMMIPWDAKVICSDDATAICLFKKSHYQIELYLEFPRMIIPKHSHPDMEVIVMDLGGGGRLKSGQQENGTSIRWGFIDKKLLADEYHGGNEISKNSNGSCFLAFQKWNNKDNITSAAIQWKGNTSGTMQETLIKEHNPNALITPGYADVSGSKC
jgi:hypothetical protein